MALLLTRTNNRKNTNLCAMFCIYDACFGGVVEEKLIHRTKFAFGMEESEEARWHPRASRNFSCVRSEFADLVFIFCFLFFFLLVMTWSFLMEEASVLYILISFYSNYCLVFHYMVLHLTEIQNFEAIK